MARFGKEGEFIIAGKVHKMSINNGVGGCVDADGASLFGGRFHNDDLPFDLLYDIRIMYARPAEVISVETISISPAPEEPVASKEEEPFFFGYHVWEPLGVRIPDPPFFTYGTFS